MSLFANNIVSIYGNKGKEWLANLPIQEKQLAALWKLDHLHPFDNLSYNFVLEGYQNDIPIVLKISLDEISLEKETEALKVFKGYGAVGVLAQTNNALLLQKADPGVSLKAQFLKGNQHTIEVACAAANRLHQAPLPNYQHFPHIKDLLSTFDKEWNIPHFHLQKARKLKDKLLEKQNTPVLLHGDMHQENILSNGNDWLVIDPKGVIGYPINEMWAFVENPKNDLEYISNYFNFKYDDAVQWYYVHAIMASCWQIEDGLDPTGILALAESVLPMIKH